MQIDKIHDWINFETNKHLGTYFSPEEIDDALERGQMDEFNDQKKHYADDEAIQDALSVFKGTYTFTNGTSPAGLLTLPDPYIYLLGIQVNAMDGSHLRYRAVEILTEDELPLRLDSQLRPVTPLDPIAMKVGEQTIQLYPQVAMAGYVYYLFNPPVPKFGYTQNGRQIVYNPATSVQMLWDDSNINAILLRALQYLGVSVEDGDIVQFTQAKITNPD